MVALLKLIPGLLSALKSLRLPLQTLQTTPLPEISHLVALCINTVLNTRGTQEARDATITQQTKSLGTQGEMLDEYDRKMKIAQ